MLMVLRRPLDSTLRPTVGMKDDPGPDPASTLHRSMQRVNDEIGSHLVGERPPDNWLRGRVDDRREEPEPAVNPEVGDVGVVDNIRLARLEASFDEVGEPVRAPVTDRRPDAWFTTTNPVDPVFVHQLGNPTTRDPPAPLA